VLINASIQQVYLRLGGVIASIEINLFY